MTSKLWGYVGIGVIVLALIALCLVQATKLVKIGKDLGESKAIQKQLETERDDARAELKDERDQHHAEIDSYSTLIETCKHDLDQKSRLAALYKTELDQVKMKPPKRETIVLESTNCTDALAEAHEKTMKILEAHREESPPN